MDDEVRSRLDAAIPMVMEAGRLTLEYFGSGALRVERKADDSPVTVADREAEHLLRRSILERFPDDGILGEEHGEHPGRSPFRWIVDPIDGTKSFICGVPLYTTLLAIEEQGRSVAGIIAAPALDEIVYAGHGGGTWHRRGDEQPMAARVSSRSLEEGTFLTSQVDTFEERQADDVFRRLQAMASITRTWGDGYGYLLVATGRAEVMVDPAMSLWDAAALQPIIEEAGGRFTDWSGRATTGSGEAVATNGKVHEQVLRITAEAARPA